MCHEIVYLPTVISLVKNTVFVFCLSIYFALLIILLLFINLIYDLLLLSNTQIYVGVLNGNLILYICLPLLLISILITS